MEVVAAWSLAGFVDRLPGQHGEGGELLQLIQADRAICFFDEGFVHEVLEFGDVHELGDNSPDSVLLLQVDDSYLYSEEQGAEEDFQVMRLKFENVGRKSPHVEHDDVPRHREQ